MIGIPKWLPAGVGLAVAVVMLALGPPARADLVLKLSDGAGDSITADLTNPSNAGSLTSSTTGSAFGSASFVSPGVLNIAASVGGFTVNVSTVSGAPAIGSPSSAQLDLSNLSIAFQGSPGGTLKITAYQTGDTLSPPGYPVGYLSSDFGGTLSGMQLTSAQAWYDASNTGTTSGAVAAFNPAFSAMSGSFSQSSPSTAVSLTGSPFALIDQVVLTANGPGSASFDLMASVAVPEPTSMMAALSAVPFLALGAVLRRRKKIAVA
jgi:hypothetical protein